MFTINNIICNRILHRKQLIYNLTQIVIVPDLLIGALRSVRINRRIQIFQYVVDASNKVMIRGCLLLISR
jgi:hypothetical protein